MDCPFCKVKCSRPWCYYTEPSQQNKEKKKGIIYWIVSSYFSTRILTSFLLGKAADKTMSPGERALGVFLIVVSLPTILVSYTLGLIWAMTFGYKGGDK